MVDGGSIESPQENPLFKMERDKEALCFIEQRFTEEGSITKETPTGGYRAPQEIAKSFPKWVQDRISSSSTGRQSQRSSDLISAVLKSLTLQDVAEFAMKQYGKQQELKSKNPITYKDSVDVWEQRVALASEVARVAQKINSPK